MCSWQLGKWSICQVANCTFQWNRTAQIYLELHFCVELHTKKALLFFFLCVSCAFPVLWASAQMIDWLICSLSGASVSVDQPGWLCRPHPSPPAGDSVLYRWPIHRCVINRRSPGQQNPSVQFGTASVSGGDARLVCTGSCCIIVIIINNNNNNNNDNGRWTIMLIINERINQSSSRPTWQRWNSSSSSSSRSSWEWHTIRYDTIQ